MFGHVDEREQRFLVAAFEREGGGAKGVGWLVGGITYEGSRDAVNKYRI